MLDPNPSIPNLSLQTPAVDFIDNHLPRHHPFFAGIPARYDPPSRRYVAASTRGRGDMAEAHRQPAPATVPTANPSRIQGRPPDTSIDRMTFWDSRFMPARAKFEFKVEKPKNRSGFDIRGAADWYGVYDKLQLARAKYKSITGLGGFLKSARRTMADSWTEPVKGIIKFVPDIDYVTPVLGAVNIILDAMKTSAEVRGQALTGFEDLQSTFSKVELFFVLWPHDDTIKEASVDLIVAVMAAIESAIGFFIQPGLKKGWDAMWQGAQYGESLKETLVKIKTCTDVLLQEADISHMVDAKNAWAETEKYFAKLDEYDKLLKKIDGRVDVAVEGINSLKNTFDDFLDMYQHNADKQRASEERRQEREQREKEERRKEQERQHEKDRQRQEELRSHQAELDAINSKFRQLQVEKAPSRAPSRAPSPCQPIPFPPPPPHAPPPQYPYFPPEALWRLLDMPALEAADLSHIAQKRLRVPARDRARAELLPRHHKFAAWISAPGPARLLVHGDFGMQPVSALSVLSAVLARALEGRRRIVRLVWFCGRHRGARGRPRAAGGAAMLRSFVAQLLCQQWVDTRLMLRDIMGFDPARARAGDMGQLLALFAWLLRQLPGGVTVFCLVDGVCFYERPEFLDDMSDVVACVALLSMGGEVDATVKLLVTSPIATKVVRDGFEDDDLILSMKGMTAPGREAGFWGLRRAAAGELEDDTSSQESEDSLYTSSDDEESEDDFKVDMSSDGSDGSASDGDSRSHTDSESEESSDSSDDSGSDDDS